jgi:hypothetical protein
MSNKVSPQTERDRVGILSTIEQKLKAVLEDVGGDWGERERGCEVQ